MKAVEFKDLSFRYLHQPETEKALAGITFDIEAGSVLGLIGKAGAGKSTLIKSLNGLVPYVELGYQDGDVIVGGLNTRDVPVNQMAHHVAIVMQNPEVQIFSLTVRDDIAFGPANLGVPRDEIFRRVQQALVDTEMEPLASRNPNDISGGEQQSLAIAGALAMHPDLLAFDEPISMLDPLGKQRVMEVLNQATRRDHTTGIISESGADIESVADIVDRMIAIDAGKVILDGTPQEVLSNPIITEIGVGCPQVTDLFLTLRNRGITLEPIPITLSQATETLRQELRQRGIQRLEKSPTQEAVVNRDFGQNIVEIENLHHYYNPEVHALKGVSIAIQERQIVGIIGQNGSGKTTLARHLVGLLKPTNKDAVLKVKNQDIRKLRIDKIIPMINYVFQNPDDQLFAESIWDEVAFAPKMMEFDPQKVKELTNEALELFDLQQYQNRYIYGLDEDLKTYLAIASILPLHPDVLLIDEPTTGLDTNGEIRMMKTLHRLRNEKNKTIIIITHNMKTIANNCDRVLVMARGELVLEGTPRDVFDQTETLLKADVLPPQITRLGQTLAEEFGCPKNILTVEEMADFLEYNLLKSAPAVTNG
jgi:energy-coupling factor transporter ATP-binding protein EcfA2